MQLLERTVADRQPVYESLIAVGRNVEAKAVGDRRIEIGAQLDDLERRWNEVNRVTVDNRATLEATRMTAREYCDRLHPFVTWLDAAEHDMLMSKPISTDLNVVQQQANRQNVCEVNYFNFEPKLMCG